MRKTKLKYFIQCRRFLIGLIFIFFTTPLWVHVIIIFGHFRVQLYRYSNHKGLAERVISLLATREIKQHTNALNLAKNNTRIEYPTGVFSFPVDVYLPELINNIEIGKNITVDPINPHPFRLLNAPSKCKSSSFYPKGSIRLVILVKSAVTNSRQRHGIRQSWGNISRYDDDVIKIVFLLAYNDTIQDNIQKEADLHEDIFQEDFIDSYLNNTHKTIMGFNWAVTQCACAKYFYFVDDDHLVLMPNLLSYIKHVSIARAHDTFAGCLIPNAPPYVNPASKWFVPSEEYPYNTWPPYLGGGSYLVSMAIAKQFCVAFPYVKYVRIDDAYLGIVSAKLFIEPQNNARFCLAKKYIRRDRVTFIAAHDYKRPDEMISTWKILHSKIIETENFYLSRA